MDTLIRLATLEDAAAACAVVRKSIAECCVEDHRNEPTLVDRWLANKTVPQFQSWLDHPAVFAIVAERQGSVVGFAMAQDCEVQLCYLVPEARFTGIGKSMLAALESHAAQTRATWIQLRSTRTARAFYLRNGFAPTGPAVLAFGLENQPMRKTLTAMNMSSSTP